MIQIIAGKKFLNRLMMPKNSIIIPILAQPVNTIYIPTMKHIVPGRLDIFKNNDFKF